MSETFQFDNMPNDFEPPGSSKVGRIILATVLMFVLLGSLAVGWWMHRSEEPVQPPAVVEEAPVAEPAPPVEEEPVEEPAVVEEKVEEQDVVKIACSAPIFEPLLNSKNVAERIVALVDSVARGAEVNTSLSMQSLPGVFLVQKENGRVFIDPDNYKRYDAIVGAFVRLNVESCTALYKKMKPKLERAYQEIGSRDRTFEQALKLAIHRLLKVPVLKKSPRLQKHIIVYQYAEEQHEALSSPEKQLLRAGPRHVKRIKKQLKAFAEALQL